MDTTSQAIGQWKTVVAASALSSIGAIIYMVAPVLLGAAIDTLNISAARGGELLSAYFLAYTVVAVSAVAWLHLAPGKTVGVVSVATFLLGLALAGTASHVGLLTVGLVMAGAAAGVAFSMSVAMIAATSEPDRFFGVALAAQVGSGGLLLFLAPAVLTPRWGFAGVLAGVAVMVVLLSMTLVWVSRAPVAMARNGSGRSAAAPVYPSLVGAAAFFIWFAGLSGVWVFLERVGNDSQLDPVTIGLVLSLSVIPGMAGALAASVLGDRAGRHRPHLVSAVAVVAAMLLLVGQPGLSRYTLAVSLFMLFWNFWIAYLLGTLTSADLTGRFSSLFTASLGLGATVGPLAAGLLLGADGFLPVILAGIAAVTVGLATALWLLSVTRVAGRPVETSAP